MSTTPTLQKALQVASGLSPLEKVQLVERLMETLEAELSGSHAKPQLYGIWADTDVSDEDIAEVRKSFGEFPRGDI